MSVLSDLTQYSNDIISGKIIACKKHRWACMRFLRDLERSATHDPEFPFEFDEAAADKFFKWMRLFTHRKGILKGKKIEPHIIQKFIFGNVYGWKHRVTGYRRFNKFYWQVARKNAKSQSLAAVGTYETFVMSVDESNETYIAATKTEQAKIVYDEAVAMLDRCKELKGRYKVAYGRITHTKSGSVMRPLSEEDRKTGDGLNPQCGIIDEYHAHEDSLIYDVIDSGMGARAQPLIGIITTAGFELNNPCYRIEYDLVSKILDPDNPIHLENYFAMVNELDKDIEGNVIDDIKDPESWKKANPIICSYPEGVDYLRKKLAEALDAPEKMRGFLTKHMNVWVNQRECGYMEMDKWALCVIKSSIDIIKKRVVAGLDLSATTDLTSIGIEIPLPDGLSYVISHSFMPEEKFLQKKKTDNVPYDLWVKQGHITVTEGAEVDYHILLEYIEAMYKTNQWAKGEICYDKYLATWLTHELMEMDFTAIEISQSYMGLSIATKDFRSKVYNKKILYDGNPVLTWALGNAVTRAGPSENIMLDKSKAKQRIDPIAALINAHVRAMVAPESKGGRVLFA